MPLAIAKGPFAGRALAVALMLALVGAVAPAAAQSASAPGSATSTPPSPTRFVTDGAGFLSASAQDELEQRLARYERDTGHQVLLWIGQTTGGEPIESWAVRAFKAWRVGRKGLDDGVAVFILAADRKVRIEVGYGLEDRVPDAVAARIIGDQMIPRLRAGDQDGAARAGVSGVLEAVGGETGAPREAAPAPGAPPELEFGQTYCPRAHRDPGARVHRHQPQAGVDAADDDRVELRPRRRQLGRGRLRRRRRLGRRWRGRRLLRRRRPLGRRRRIGVVVMPSRRTFLRSLDTAAVERPSRAPRPGLRARSASRSPASSSAAADAWPSARSSAWACTPRGTATACCC